MKQLLHFINLFLLLILVGSQHKCQDDEFWKEETKACASKKCPYGQEWFERTKKCVKFRIIASGSARGLTKLDEERRPQCLGGFVWIEKRQLCAKKGRVCKDELCRPPTTRDPNLKKSCFRTHEWDSERQKCVPRKVIVTITNNVTTHQKSQV